MQGRSDTQLSLHAYFAIYLESLRLDSVLDFDLYLKVGTEAVLYRASNLPFSQKTLDRLLEQNVTRLYISHEDRHQYQRYIESNINEIVADTTIAQDTKAGIVYDSAILLARDVLDNPTLGENIRRSRTFVESTVAFVLSSRRAFHSLLKVMSFDYYTYTHSVNVCTFALALAEYTGIHDLEELSVLGSGALLHDVGKTRIDEAILNKQTPLTSSEMDMIKMHPRWGVDLLQASDVLAEESYFPVIEHHERENGSGYPRGLTSGQIHTHSKFVAIADVFDAMTTRRIYRPAKAAYPALKEMFSDSGAFDRTLLERFTHLMGPTDLADV
ncbi:MAG: HD domain-containing protein [candidate division Zixibacteria bacterium]|nr:HD domain-containing protein [candidate division Zixibacteria bacterium]